MAPAACGGSHHRATGDRSRATPAAIAPAAMPSLVLPASARGPTTCTVYGSGFGTQVIFDSQSLNVSPECQAWTAREPGAGYLWAYQPTGAAIDATAVPICDLRDPSGRVAVPDLRWVLVDLREPDHGDGVLQIHLAAIDLLQEMDHLIDPAELRVVVLDVPRREVLDALDLDLVDHGVEDLLPRRMLVADRHQHAVVLAVLMGLVTQPNRRRLPPTAKLVGKHRRVEVEDPHDAPAYRSEARRDSARATISRSPE